MGHVFFDLAFQIVIVPRYFTFDDEVNFLKWKFRINLYDHTNSEIDEYMRLLSYFDNNVSMGKSSFSKFNDMDHVYQCSKLCV
jgi:hypothetical protein